MQERKKSQGIQILPSKHKKGTLQQQQKLSTLVTLYNVSRKHTDNVVADRLRNTNLHVPCSYQQS